MAALVAGACGGGSRAEMGPLRTDSAGVAMVENRGPAWGGDEGWRLTSEPLVVIGASPADTLDQLFAIGGAVRLQDGSIVVADGGSNSLRRYDAGGSFVSALGREGEGPGEFRSIRGVYLVGDTIAVVDYRTRRVTWVSPDLALVGSVSLRDLGGLASVWGFLGDGSFVVWGLEPTRPDEWAPGLNQEVEAVHRVSPDAGDVQPLGDFFIGEHFVASVDDRWISAAVPFGRSAHAWVSDAALLYTAGDAPQVERYDREGVLRAVIRWPEEPRRVPDDAIQRRIDALPEGGPRQAITTVLRQIPVPEFTPLVSDLVVDAAGRIWVQAYLSREEEGPSTWRVLDADGTLLGSVTMPSRFRPTQIGDDFVLGSGQDEFDVELVQLYGIVRRVGMEGGAPE